MSVDCFRRDLSCQLESEHFFLALQMDRGSTPTQTDARLPLYYFGEISERP